MKKFFTAICAAALLLVTGCGADSQAREAPALDTIKISIGGKNFSATLEDNPTARAFAAKLPLEVDMSTN